MDIFGGEWRALSVCQFICNLAKVLGIAPSHVCGYTINRGLPAISLVGGTDTDDKIGLRCDDKDGKLCRGPLMSLKACHRKVWVSHRRLAGERFFSLYRVSLQ